MFYDVFCTLCEVHNVKPSRVMIDLEMSKSAATRWKNGSIPSGDVLQKIADYFGVTVDYLLNGETKKSPDMVSEDEELTEYLNRLKNNPGMRILFSKTKNATKEDIEKVIKMFDIMRGEDSGGYYY